MAFPLWSKKTIIYIHVNCNYCIILFFFGVAGRSQTTSHSETKELKFLEFGNLRWRKKIWEGQFPRIGKEFCGILKMFFSRFLVLNIRVYQGVMFLTYFCASPMVQRYEIVINFHFNIIIFLESSIVWILFVSVKFSCFMTELI